MLEILKVVLAFFMVFLMVCFRISLMIGGIIVLALAWYVVFALGLTWNQ